MKRFTSLVGFADGGETRIVPYRLGAPPSRFYASIIGLPQQTLISRLGTKSDFFLNVFRFWSRP